MKGLRVFVSIPGTLREWSAWCAKALDNFIADSVAFTGDCSFAAPPVLPVYTVATLPDAATYARGMIYVSDEAGGPTIAFSDAADWRRLQDRVVVS